MDTTQNDTRSQAVIACAALLGEIKTAEVLKALIELYDRAFMEGVRCADRAPVVRVVGDER